MDFKVKYDIFAEARAVLDMKSPLETFTANDIGTFVLAWSSHDTGTSIPGTLMGFGCDGQGEYALVKAWSCGQTARYTLVAPLPPSMCPDSPAEIRTALRRDPEVKAPEMPL